MNRAGATELIFSRRHHDLMKRVLEKLYFCNGNYREIMEVYDHQVITCYEMKKSFRAYLYCFSTLRNRFIVFLSF